MRDLASVFAIYRDCPMANGDAVLLCEPDLCVEVPGLADEWDPQLRVAIARSLRGMTQQVQVAISRPEADLLPQDHALWADLREELRGQVTLLPLIALPAA